MPNEQQLNVFLHSVVSSEETLKDSPISKMDHCGLLLKKVKKSTVMAFPTESSTVDKVRLLLENYDIIKATSLTIALLINIWMEDAIAEGLYSLGPSFPSSSASGSTVSVVSNGTLETISLSSHDIADELAMKIIKAAVFTAYTAGKHRHHSHRSLCKDFGQIFQTARLEYIDAMAAA